MSTPQPGAMSPYQGQVVTPSAQIDPLSSAAHGFLGVIRTLIQRSGIFHEEADMLDALRKVEAYAKQLVKPNELRHLNSIHDVQAPIEDVRDRRVPNAPPPVPAQYGGAPIDYDKLARAFLAVQQQQQNPEVHTVTDVPATDQYGEQQ